MDLVSFEQVPLNVVLVFDTSGSVTDERMGSHARCRSAGAERTHENDQAALVTFSHAAPQRAPLTSLISTRANGADVQAA